MRYIVIAFCIYLSHVAIASEADALAAIKNEKIPLEAQVLSGEELVTYLKKNQNLFTVEITPHSHNIQHKLMDLRFVNQNRKPVVEEARDEGEDIPKYFDARTKWPYCHSLFHIRDQANCAAGWAIATASALSDRICIASKGEKQVIISSAEFISCCDSCGHGCEGGWPIKAFVYFLRRGAVTGGDYGDEDCCLPYPFHPCGRHGNETYYGECWEMASTPQCVTKCQKGYRRTYRRDKKYGEDAYEVPNSVKAIQREIMKSGPVVATFTTYEDFGLYRSGIYRHYRGRSLGAHSVKIIGWGNENGTDYWLIANSWHNDWGEDGYFRMIRGTNDCGIEEGVVAGHVCDCDYCCTAI